MKIEELVEKYKKNNNIDLTKILEVKKYIPILDKYNFAGSIFAHSVNVENGIYTVDSLTRYLNFTVGVIGLYTNLEFSENPIEDYDKLCEAGLVEPIIATFETEYGRVLKITNDVFNDNFAANNSIEATVAKAATSIVNKVDDVLNSVKETVESNMDTSGLEGLFELMNK